MLHIWFALGKLCSQLLCASGGFFGESQPGECEKSCLFFLSVCVLVFAGKCLDGKSGAGVRKEKANVEKKKILTVCELIFGYTLRR